MEFSKLYLFNTSILPNVGTYEYTEISLATAIEIIKQHGNPISTVGHQATADVMSIDLGIEVSLNRSESSLAVWDSAIVFKLNKRLQTYIDLNETVIREIGYSYYLLQRIK